jgi:hypothetical protein
VPRRVVDLGRTRLLWVPGATGIADASAPALAELNAVGVKDLTCLMVTTYEVRPDASDTTNERAVCETANVTTATIRNYMGRMDLFRDWDETDPLNPGWTTDDVLEWLDYLDLGWFVRRNGLAYDAALAEGQVVETYKFAADEPQTNAGTGSGFMKAMVPLLPQGTFDTHAVIGGVGS